MHPLQIWLPTFHAALCSAEEQRDMRRAWDAWRGEHVVWLLPGLTKPQRWIEVPAGPGLPDNAALFVLAVPGEHTECVRIYHATDTGVVWGPGATDCFPGLTIARLLDTWINPKPCEVAFPPPTRAVKVPTIREHENGVEVTYVEKRFSLRPGGTFKTERLGRRTNASGKDEVGLRISWPPADMPVPVAPEAESAAYYAPYLHKAGDPPQIMTSLGQSERDVLLLEFRWPEPFTRLIGSSGTMDLWWHQSCMVEVVQQSADNLDQALRDARNKAGEYVTSGWTSRENLVFWPTVMTKGWMSAFRELERQTTQQITTWEEVLRRPSIMSWLATRQEITRVWGPIGLFWALLLEQLESKRPYRLCKWCRRALQGKKTQCSPEDDLSCYTEWRRKARAGQRARKPRTV